MDDKKRFIIILITAFIVFSIYYYYDDIKLNVANIKDKGISSVFKKTIPTGVVLNPNKEVEKVIINEQDAVVDVVQKSSPAVVSIVRKATYFDFFQGPVKSEDSIGTGFIIDGKSWIVLTNKHVVTDDAASYSIITADKETFEVSNVYKDPINDFAILKLDKKGVEGKTLPQLSFGDSDKLKVGQTVIAIGNSLGEFGNSVTKGIVSGLKRGIVAGTGVYGNAESLDNVIQTDAALNPGNSGGPLLDLAGNVIGVNVAISSGAQSVGFSLPINTLKPVIESFLKDGTIKRPYLGVKYIQITKEISDKRAVPVGAFVEAIVRNSPADKAGIKAGDIIIKINKQRIDDNDNTLVKIISKQEVNKDIEIVIDRNGKEITVSVKLEDASTSQNAMQQQEQVQE